MAVLYIAREPEVLEILSKRATCGFQEWKDGSMGSCGKPVVAFVRTNPKTFLCKEHCAWHIAHQQPEKASLTKAYAKSVKVGK